jgi:hypothetical protein
LLPLLVALEKLVGEVSIVFHATIANKAIVEEGEMRAKQEFTYLHRWYQQLKNTQQ